MRFEWLDMECQPVRPRYIHCDGMEKLLAMPCMTAWYHLAHPSDPEICIEWRKAKEMTMALVPKVIINPSGPTFRNYWTRTYAQFNWKTKTQYHFARFTESISPFEPLRARCVYLFKGPFRWGRYSAFYPDPINLYTRFRDMPLLPDGTPDVLFKKTWWAWEFPPDPMEYTPDEWKIVTDWEKVVFHYNHAYKVCVAKYEFEGERVTNTITGQVGVVVDISPPERQSETWHPGTPTAKGAVLQKQWMKLLPLQFKVQMPDGSYFTVPRKYITRL